MTAYRCQPVHGPIDANVSLPGSKSITNRALVMASLADGPSLLTNVLLAEDTLLMVEALRSLGVVITIDEADGVAEVTGCSGHLPASEASLFCGNSGTTMRFCTALVALGIGEFKLDGVERMRSRPLGDLVSVLRTLGARIDHLIQDGYPPIEVYANGLAGGHVSLHSPPSSQLVSALLMVAPYARRDLFIEITGEVRSKPFLAMTTRLMSHFGVGVLEQDVDEDAPSMRFIVEASQRYRGVPLTIEPDATNATYFLAAPAIVPGIVTVEHLGTDSLQGDVRFVDVLEKMGCRVDRRPDSLSVRSPANNGPLSAVDVDLNDMPDTAQTLAVVSLFAKGVTHIRNVGSLRTKETDRLSALTKELTKLGANVEEGEDSLHISPPDRLTPATIDTYNDHRMAMSFALAGLSCEGVTINNPACCGKTFPGFFDQYEAL